jgi:hypothetical protein
VGLFWRPALKQLGIFFVDLDELDEAFDAEVGERLDSVFANTIDPMAPSSISISLATSHNQSSSSPRSLATLVMVVT